jgi:enamine deaminase RidA (YjgF/YER057c/UK114 family)
MKQLAFLLLTMTLFAAEKQPILPGDAPYSPGIAAGDFFYVSGHGVVRDGQGQLPPGGPEAWVRQTLDNVKKILVAGGLTMEHVVFAQVYLHESTPQAAFEQVWRETFPNKPPARAVLGVYRMPTETPVEINAVAVRDLKLKTVYATPAGVGVRAGNRFYASGAYGATTQEALNGLETILKAAKLDLAHLVFVNPYLAPSVTITKMNEDYAKRFPHGYAPARATIPVTYLPGNAAVEFSGVAVMDLKDRRVVRPKNMPPSATASPCVWALDGGKNDTLFCSAKAGFVPGPNGGIYADNVEHQVIQSLRNLLDGFEEAGLDFSHAVWSNVYLDQIDEWGRMNAVYRKYFGKVPPVRTTVGPVAPVGRKRNENGHAPKLVEIALIAVR